MKTNKQDVIEVLNQLGQRINRWYPAINNGGCCVFAAIVGRELARRGFRVRVIVANRWPNVNIEEVKTNLKCIHSMYEWEENGVSFTHVGIEFQYNGRWWHYDTNGVHPKRKTLDGIKVNPGRLTVAEAELLARYGEDWNDMFSRRKIPSLRRHIVRYLGANLPLTAQD